MFHRLQRLLKQVNESLDYLRPIRHLRSMALGLHSQDTVLADPMAQGGTNSPLLVRG